jgi:hypothetical protein
MYYGNTDDSISTTSDGEETFPFFDDFDTLDTNKWFPGIRTSTSDGVLLVEPMDGDYDPPTKIWRGMHSIRYFEPFNISWRSRTYLSPGSYNLAGMGNMFKPCPEGDSMSFFWAAAEGTRPAYESVYTTNFLESNPYGSIPYCQDEINIGILTDYHTYELMWTNDNFEEKVAAYVDNEYKIAYNAHPGLPNVSLSVVFEVCGATLMSDWVLIRPCIATEPSHGIWSEQEERPTFTELYTPIFVGVIITIGAIGLLSRYLYDKITKTEISDSEILD